MNGECLRGRAPKVVSFFAGCGGSSLGYEWAGCRVALACDFDDNAIRTYRLNFPGTPTLQADIRTVTGGMVMERTGLAKGELDILDGSPPCTPFSMSGKRHRGWGKSSVHSSEAVAQRTDDLFMEYLRLVAELRPRCFVAENVKGLTIGKAKGYFNEILRVGRGLGYDVGAFDLNARDFGTAQSRPRVIFVGVRGDVPQDRSAKLLTRPEISFEQATAGLDYPPEELETARRDFEGSAVIPRLWELASPGQYFNFVQSESKNFNSVRIRRDRPVPTIMTGSKHQVCHYAEPRMLTLGEAKRCCGFPDSFKFLSIVDGWRRLGNSVPPKLMQAVAEYVRRRVGLY
jgi:DNA (cytosine-5)-methyltransferase 1